MEKGQLSGNRLLYLAGLTLLFVLAFSYIFNEKLDMNGDNCTYYMLSTSIAEGHGYADITNAAHNPSNVFPPGYPLLMSVIRFFTDSFFPQKVLNGLYSTGSSFWEVPCCCSSSSSDGACRGRWRSSPRRRCWSTIRYCISRL